MKRRTCIIFLISCVMLLAATATALAADYIDTGGLDKGLFSVSYKSGARLKVSVTHGTTTYYYDLDNGGKKESFPLQLGNGDYTMKLLENTTGTKYKTVQSKSVKLSLSDPNMVYLNSVQVVDWSKNPQSVTKAAELTKSVSDSSASTSTLWTYMAHNNKYDYNKLATLPTTYLPTPDKTLSEKSGICYDFSSLFASMLRSGGVPTRLVKGYAPGYATGYHAWNEVYDSVKKQWIVIDTTYDLQIYAKGKTVTMAKPADKYQKVYQY